MSIGVISTIQSRLAYGAEDGRDLRDPGGIWFQNQDVIGDATGGEVDFQFSFGKRQVFSVEGVRVSMTGTLAFYNLLWLPGFSTGFELAWSVALEATTGATVAHRSNGPLYAAIPHSWPTPTGPFPLLRMVFTNVTGESFVAEAWGYYWDLAALRQSGGPRRPIASA